MINAKELLQKIESGDVSYEDKLAALGQVETALKEMRERKETILNDRVGMIVDALKTMQAKVAAQLEEAKAIVPEVGPAGPKGDPGERGLDGTSGRDGRDGVDGRNGVDGQDGVSVTDAKIDFDGSLVITLSTGREINVGEVVAPDLAEKIKLVTSGGGTSQQVLDTLASLQTQIDTLIPSQTGNAGKFLTTDGTNTSWATVAGGGAVDSVNGQTGVVVLDAADVGALPTTGGTVTGPTVVEMSSTSTALRVTQTGTGNALVVEDAANPDSSPFVVTSTGLVGVRNSSPSAALDVTGSAVISEILEVGVSVELDGGNSYLIANAGDTFVGGSGDLYLETGLSQTAIRASGTNQNVGIGVAPNTSKLAVGGVVESTTGGFKFPDATTQTTAASALTVQDEGTTLTSAATSLNFTGAGVTATNTGGAVTVAITGGGGGGISSADIQEFTTAGSSTWTKPAGAKLVYVLAFGGGGGGGSGRRRATASVATAASGGGGGGGGGRTELWIPAAALGSTETVTVGAGGTGGPARTIDDTSGLAGVSGDDSLFGSWALARGGSTGSGGNTTSGTSGAGGGGLGEVALGSTAYTASGGAGNTTNGATAGRGGYRPGGGGGAAGLAANITVASNGQAGGKGGSLLTNSTSTAGGGGSSGSANTNGGNGSNSTTYFVGGDGGGAGGSGLTSPGSGGNGGYPGGGGGGGAAGQGVDSGAGGNGGDGYVRVVTFF